jgi:hypothetical protein
MMMDHADALLDSGPTAQAAAASSLNLVSSSHSDQQPQRKNRQQQRQLQQLIENAAEDVLDSFRRGTPRCACAHSAAYGWSMSSVASEGVDVAAYRQMVAGHDIVDLLTEAARLLNR